MGALASVTDETFARDVLASSGTVVVDFWAEWCPPCTHLEPVHDLAPYLEIAR